MKSNELRTRKLLADIACLVDVIIIVTALAFLAYVHLSDVVIGAEEWLNIFAGFGIASAISMFLDFLHRN